MWKVLATCLNGKQNWQTQSSYDFELCLCCLNVLYAMKGSGTPDEKWMLSVIILSAVICSQKAICIGSCSNDNEIILLVKSEIQSASHKRLCLCVRTAQCFYSSCFLSLRCEWCVDELLWGSVFIDQISPSFPDTWGARISVATLFL